MLPSGSVTHCGQGKTTTGLRPHRTGRARLRSDEPKALGRCATKSWHLQYTTSLCAKRPHLPAPSATAQQKPWLCGTRGPAWSCNLASSLPARSGSVCTGVPVRVPTQAPDFARRTSTMATTASGAARDYDVSPRRKALPLGVRCLGAPACTRLFCTVAGCAVCWENMPGFKRESMPCAL